MKQLRIILRLAIFAVILNGVSQAFITYAVVPGKYSNESYNTQEVKEIAYQERQGGIDSLYVHCYANGVAFAILGMLMAVEMWVSSRIDWLGELKRTEHDSKHQPKISNPFTVVLEWPLLLVAALLVLGCFFLFCG